MNSLVYARRNATGFSYSVIAEPGVTTCWGFMVTPLTIRMILGEKELLTKANLDEITRERLQDRIARLNKFIEMANTLALELRQRIQETPSDQKSAG
nr:hypothetical protein [Nitrosospira multiformis]